MRVSSHYLKNFQFINKMEFKEILLQKQLLDRLKNIEEAIKEINKKLDGINISSPPDSKHIIIKKNQNKTQEISNFSENLPHFEKRIVKKYLNARNAIGDENFLKLILFKGKTKDCYPIRNLDGRKNFQYYYNRSWIDDNGGEYIKKQLIRILEKYYLSANQFTDNSDMLDMVDNQKYINQLKTEKHMTKLLNNLKKYINV